MLSRVLPRGGFSELGFTLHRPKLRVASIRGLLDPKRKDERSLHQGPCLRQAVVESDSLDFQERKEQLKRCLSREYRSFFRPFEAEFYREEVSFKDPLNDLEGKDKYRKNVEMLSGESLVGNILFTDGFIDLHAVEEIPGSDRRLRTRWTLGFKFRLLPWQPRALFTGVSDYEIDGNAQVLSQRDYWDTINLGSSGSYMPEAPLAGVTDLLTQFLPSFLLTTKEPAAASAGEWSLLRRAEKYRVYRSAKDGLVFAITTPGVPGDLDSLKRVLGDHGLAPGAAVLAHPRRGDVVASTGQSFSDAEEVNGFELLTPHPWQGDAPLG